MALQCLQKKLSAVRITNKNFNFISNKIFLQQQNYENINTVNKIVLYQSITAEIMVSPKEKLLSTGHQIRDNLPSVI